MKRFFGLGQSLRSRIILFCSALLIAVQGVAFLIVNDTSLKSAEQRAKQELESGNRVFKRLLSYHTEQLTNASVVLTSDFGFRRAAATADGATIRSALENHGSRIGADVMMLVSQDNRVMADTRPAVGDGLPTALAPLITRAKVAGRATGYVVLDGQVLQATVLPVLAPDVVAWVVLGFEVDEKFVEELKALTNLHISVVKVTEGGATVLASSLIEEERRKLLADLAGENTPLTAVGESVTSHGSYFTRTIELAQAGSAQVFALLQRPMTDTYYHLSQLRRLLTLLAAISILISVIGIVLIANTVTRPLRTLATVAEKIKEGDYSSAANIAEQGEIGLLAESFNVMRDSISTLLRLAYRDPLTSLPNRAMFNDRIDQAIKLARRRHENFSLLFIDLDRFKPINDTYGHDAGDRVLKAVAKKLQESVRETDTVARLGGDEFAIILLTDEAEVVDKIMGKIHTRIGTERVDVGPERVAVGCSIGVAHYPRHGASIASLMRHADLAMYVDKERRTAEVALSGQRYLDPPS